MCLHVPQDTRKPASGPGDEEERRGANLKPRAASPDPLPDPTDASKSPPKGILKTPPKSASKATAAENFKTPSPGASGKKEKGAAARAAKADSPNAKAPRVAKPAQLAFISAKGGAGAGAAPPSGANSAVTPGEEEVVDVDRDDTEEAGHKRRRHSPRKPGTAGQVSIPPPTPMICHLMGGWVSYDMSFDMRF